LADARGVPGLLRAADFSGEARYAEALPRDGVRVPLARRPAQSSERPMAWWAARNALIPGRQRLLAVLLARLGARLRFLPQGGEARDFGFG
jgi:hypothetical protein